MKKIITAAALTLMSLALATPAHAHAADGSGDFATGIDSVPALGQQIAKIPVLGPIAGPILGSVTNGNVINQPRR